MYPLSSMWVFGIAWILWGVAAFFFPRAMYSAKVEKGLERLGTKRWYRIHQTVNRLVLGAGAIGVAFIPGNGAYFVFAGVFLSVVVSMALCNKKCLGMAFS